MIGDFHIHGRYAQACSKTTTLEDLERNARIKGLNILGTGDCQHPLWYKEITSKLAEDENGVLWTKNKFPFIWQTEISLAYTHNGKGRRVHHVVLLPSGDVVKQFIDALLKKGRIDYDGRPIFGMSSIEFLEMLRSISLDIEIIPAHMWTSWFGILGSKSGYDSVDECFEDKAKYIHALETGMSSDINMNRRLSRLDMYNLVSFSDPHSSHPWRLGREATIFDCELKYKEIVNAIRTGEGLAGTIETNPEYGKYHFDGHRMCGVTFSPEESNKMNKICPKCRLPLTIGVANRVEELADREKPVNVNMCKMTIPLHELIAAVYGIKQIASRKVQEVYFQLLKVFGSEYSVLFDASKEALEKVVHPRLIEIIIKNRTSSLRIKPGFDGVYGQIELGEGESIKESKQRSLGDY